MGWTGGCQCGAVRYEVKAAPKGGNYCHCRMCQRLSGSVVTTWVTFPKDAIQFTHGEPKLYRSSEIAERGHCADCGSQLFFRAFAEDTIDVSTGTFDNPENLPPDVHWGVESQVPWLTIEDDLPRKRTDEWLEDLGIPEETRPS